MSMVNAREETRKPRHRRAYRCGNALVLCLAIACWATTSTLMVTAQRWVSA